MKWFDDSSVTRRLFVSSVVLSIASVLGITLVGKVLGIGSSFTPYYFMNDSGKVLAFLSGVSCFLFFKNLKIPNSRLVNAVASTTFGVLLIHAHSDAMRAWLWVDLLDIPGAYLTMPLQALALYMVIVMLGVFAVCSALDYARLRLTEPLYMGWFDRRFPSKGRRELR